MQTEDIKKIYGGYAGFYDLIFKGFFYPRIKYGINLLEIMPGEKVLEIGVGTGLSLTTYPRYCEVVGVDLSLQMLKKAQKKVKMRNLCHVSLHEMDASNLTFEDSSFDYVVAAFVITVVPDPIKVISEMKRVSKKNGKLLIINHFQSQNKFLGKIEEAISPFCKKIGWRSDLQLEDLAARANLKIKKEYRIKKVDLWKIIFAENNK